MTSCRRQNPAAVPRLVQFALACLVAVTTLLGADALASPDTTQQSDPNQLAAIPSNPDVRVADPSGILTPQQLQNLNATLDRLARLGTETIFYFQDAQYTASAGANFADDLRIAWEIESTVGARDGLVVVVNVDRTDPRMSSISTSAGLGTFPIRRLSEAGFAELVENVALPQVQAGDPFGGMSDLAELTLGTLIDDTGTLTERQITTLDGDIRRLNELGLPTLVYVRSAADAETGDQQFADDLLEQWSTGADDTTQNQMVVLVTLDEEDPSQSTISYAAEADAFPIRQLTADGYQSLLDNEALLPLQDGDVYLSLAYAIRKAINFAEYSPPSPAALSDIQRLFQEPLNILAALAVQAAIAMYVLVPAVIERRLTLTPAPRSMTFYILTTAALGMVVGVLGVLDRNRASALAGLGVFLLATVFFPLFRAGLLAISGYLTTRRRDRQITAKDVAHVS